MTTPLRIINAVAPTRICDIGGWTDTWFAEHGAVFNIAVYPFVQAQVFVYPRAARQERITIFAENYGETFAVAAEHRPQPAAGSRQPADYSRKPRSDREAQTISNNPRSAVCGLQSGVSSTGNPQAAGCRLPAAGSSSKHPLLEAAFAVMKLPDDIAIEVHLYAEMPPGASTGTSAAVSTALIGALDRLTAGPAVERTHCGASHLTAHEVARLAHRIETEVLGLQCGIQDQIASAYGGVNFIEMTRYPQAAVSTIQVANSVWWELERRLVLVYLGSAHVSSDIHKLVIQNFEASGPNDPRLVGLREQARAAKNALLAGDFAALAAAMNANTEWQKQMHPGIFGAKAATTIALAADHGAIGWKLNGAGGNGGSITFLFGPASHDQRAFAAALPASLPEARVIPIYLSRFGLRVWETTT